MSIVCEALATKAELASISEDFATKAELQELKNQINQLLGQTDNGGLPIDVLALGAFAGTAIGNNFTLVKESVQTIELAGTVADDIGRALADGTAQWVSVKGSGARTPLPDLTSVSKNTAAKASVGIKGAKVAASTAALVSTVATMVASVGLTIATVEILGSRIDLAEKDQLQRDKDYTNLINILSRNNQDIDEANSEIESLQEALSEQSNLNSEILDDIESAQLNIEELEANAEKQQKEYTKLEETFLEFKEEVERYEAEAIQSIDDLKATVTVLETDLATAKGNIDNLFEVVEKLSTDLADKEARLTEQGVKIEALEVVTSVQIAELTNLKSAIENNETLTDARLDNLEAQIVLGKNQVSTGGGTSSAVREAVSNQQNKTLELMNNLADPPLESLPDIQPYEYDNPDNPFNDVFNQLLPRIIPQTTGDGDVDIDALSNRLNDDFTQTLTELGIVGLTDTVNQVRNQTTTEAIKSATEEAICDSTKPNGCIAKDIKDPLTNGQNSLSNNVNNILQGLDLAQGQNILNIVQDTNNFMKKAWSTTRMDKVLNVLNTVLAFHNALMLSRNLGQTLGDVASQALQFLGIRDAEDNPIDINSVIGSTVNSWITNIVGAETYANIQQSWTNLNRIMVAGQGILYSVQGIKNAVLEAQEIVGNWTAKIGNNLQVQGIFEDDSYPWMNENINFRNPFNKFIQKIDLAEEVVSQGSSLVSSGVEAQENFNELFNQNSELKTASEELQETLSNFSETKETEVAEQTLESASPEIENVDVVKAEA